MPGLCIHCIYALFAIRIQKHFSIFRKIRGSAAQISKLTESKVEFVYLNSAVGLSYLSLDRTKVALFQEVNVSNESIILQQPLGYFLTKLHCFRHLDETIQLAFHLMTQTQLQTSLCRFLKKVHNTLMLQIRNTTHK